MSKQCQDMRMIFQEKGVCLFACLFISTHTNPQAPFNSLLFFTISHISFL